MTNNESKMFFASIASVDEVKVNEFLIQFNENSSYDENSKNCPSAAAVALLSNRLDIYKLLILRGFRLKASEALKT